MLLLNTLVSTGFAQATTSFTAEEQAMLTERFQSAVLSMGIFMLIVGIPFLIFWVKMLIHAISKPIDNKVVWVLLMIFFQIPAAIVYYFAVKKDFKN